MGLEGHHDTLGDIGIKGVVGAKESDVIVLTEVFDLKVWYSHLNA